MIKDIKNILYIMNNKMTYKNVKNIIDNLEDDIKKQTVRINGE